MKYLSSSILAAAIVFCGCNLALAQDGADDLIKARLAAVEGDHATCARLADKARRLPNAVWQAHQLYASCQAFAIEAQRDKISVGEYISGLNKSIDALQFLLETPGLINSEEQRGSIQFVIQEFEKRIASAKG